MRNLKVVTLLVISLSGFTMTAQAANLEILSLGANASQLPTSFNPSHLADINNFAQAGGDSVIVGAGSQISVFTVANKTTANGLAVTNVTNGNDKLRFTYFGKEAGFENLAIVFDGGFATLFSASNKPDNGSISAEFTLNQLGLSNGGMVPFLLRRLTGGVLDANNSGLIAGNLSIGFSQLFTNSDGVTNGSVLALFDDGGGSQDRDFDDFVLGIGVIPAAIPLPASMLFLLTGLFCFGIVSKKRGQFFPAI
ncbi:MAG: hypothetical protein RIM72_21295 [Alphaproteobacteria bacterium]